MKFKDVVDAVHDIRRTVELDGEGWASSTHTIWLTQEQWDELVADAYVQTLPASAIEALNNHMVLGVNVRVRP